jgi:hypothetical protein
LLLALYSTLTSDSKIQEKINVRKLSLNLPIIDGLIMVGLITLDMLITIHFVISIFFESSSDAYDESIIC